MSGKCAKCADGVPTCEFEGCDRPQRGHKTGLCNKHRQRLRKHGHPGHERWGSLSDRVEARIDRSGECWVWTGAKGAGYGQVWDGARMVGVHRLMWEAANGPIPDGLVIDHLCRNPACCNPDHLEPVTQAENARRGLNGALRQTRSDYVA